MISIDPVTLAVTSFAMVATASPFVYYSYKLKKLTTANLASFEEFSTSNNAVPTQHERWRNHYHLGLDCQSKKLVYHRFGSYPEQSIIDLNEVNKVSIQEKSHMIHVGKEKRHILEYLALQFHFKDSSHSPKTVEIYDGELFSDLAGERSIAEKWQRILEKNLKSPI
ncbi:hypothetical protein SAMN04489724_4072 [Algoriphagus locisalis]|uniref:Uncharacterized protein n=1 Tax=Algoriphagus locisalis TaxID=305507 RepID=A0A1I7DK85_9BACT|nr:hypothetical protein [Algoriphagus locisalis]SFU12091.1 hypothetical protein SAMN04489724_4072 [Algoriphagus locisalis]